MAKTTNLKQEERELLIRISVQLENLSTEFKEMKADFSSKLSGFDKKVSELESGKVSYQAFREYKDEITRYSKEMEIAWNKDKDDKEKRLRIVEKYGAIAIGALAALEFILKFFVK